MTRHAHLHSRHTHQTHHTPRHLDTYKKTITKAKLHKQYNIQTMASLASIASDLIETYDVCVDIVIDGKKSFKLTNITDNMFFLLKLKRLHSNELTLHCLKAFRN